MENNNYLGKRGKDKITGFEGVIVSEHRYLTGCTQYGIQPGLDKDGKVGEKFYFDEGRIEITGDGFTKESVAADEPGCDDRDRPSG